MEKVISKCGQRYELNIVMVNMIRLAIVALLSTIPAL